MILIFHSNKSVVSVVDTVNNNLIDYKNLTLSKLIFDLASNFSDELIFWCDVNYKDIVNFKAIPLIFHSKNIFSTYSISGKYVISDSLQYVDNSFFCRPVRNVKSPTYFMSSEIGGISSSLLLVFAGKVKLYDDFDYFLCSFAKLSIPLGVFCYSDPALVVKSSYNIKISNKVSLVDFKFVSQHWKKGWLFFLFMLLILREKKVLFLSFIKSFFYQRQYLDSINLSFNNSNEYVSKDYDVIIPTIGRSEYLKLFLSDLREQSILPKNVIIIEQNPELESKSDLYYLKTESYPFSIVHRFTHVTGACNARNVALELVKSSWVFLADDDIRISKNFFEHLFDFNSIKANVAYTISCLKMDEIKRKKYVHQWDSFGSGCSFVSFEILKNIRFDSRFEFGFGEDSDFGMQIRKLGYDVIYLPFPEIIHLKAPIGGFRTKPVLLWDKEVIPPKPSPTIFLFLLKHKSIKQIYSFKVYLFFIYYFKQSIKNPFKYYSYFQKQWNVSNRYANMLFNL